MKLIIVACALVAVVSAAPADTEPVEILRYDFDTKPDGSYVVGFQTADGTQREEVGTLKQAVDEDNKPHDVVVVRGSFSYPDPTGHIETINYYADETGFHANGDSIPKVPARR